MTGHVIRIVEAAMACKSGEESTGGGLAIFTLIKLVSYLFLICNIYRIHNSNSNIGKALGAG